MAHSHTDQYFPLEPVSTVDAESDEPRIAALPLRHSPQRNAPARIAAPLYPDAGSGSVPTTANNNDYHTYITKRFIKFVPFSDKF